MVSEEGVLFPLGLWTPRLWMRWFSIVWRMTWSVEQDLRVVAEISSSPRWFGLLKWKKKTGLVVSLWMSLRCSWKLSANFLLVSPIKDLLHILQMRIWIRLIDLHMNVSRILKVPLGKLTHGVWMRKRHALHLGWEHLVVSGESVVQIGSLICTNMSFRFLLYL